MGQKWIELEEHGLNWIGMMKGRISSDLKILQDIFASYRVVHQCQWPSGTIHPDFRDNLKASGAVLHPSDPQ